MYTQNQILLHIHLYIEHVCNSGTIQWDSGEEGEEKRMIDNNIKINICVGRQHNETH
jgi:hypothetical protein